jgi:hypothetical protein
MDKFAQWDPEWTERCARMTNNPWNSGVLPVKWIELICIALNAACTHLNEAGIRRHIRAALDAGATGEEIRETFKGGTSSRSDSVGISATADPARVSCACICPTSVCVPDEKLRQLFRAAERDAVAGQDLIWRDVQALGD